jgi:hypothetical protein
MIVESHLVAAEIAELAAMLHADPPLRALAREGNLASVRTLSPTMASALDAALARVGHRGPGDAELSSPTFGDDPTMLLLAAAADPEHATPPPTPAPRASGHTGPSRERSHDATLRFTHHLRMALRELGTRRVAADLIDFADDVYYLTCDELVTMPADARLRIKRRRAERERFQAQRPPDVIDGRWAPVDPGPASPG